MNIRSFNTQPPEGGWNWQMRIIVSLFEFQHTAARRRLGRRRDSARMRDRFNTQPPEGGWRHRRDSARTHDRFNTQPPEGGWEFYPQARISILGFNTQPPEGGWARMYLPSSVLNSFQHTAARRRLGDRNFCDVRQICFNTQPPEGGW